jgi:aryl-alcohol dehydrogenase-like predicted oxidoreductase
VAKHYHAPLATVALAWLIARPGITSAISSATSPEQLKDLIRATRLKLDHSSIELLNQASVY